MKNTQKLIENDKIMKTNNTKLCSLHNNNIREIDGNGKINQTNNAKL